ncbi:sensor histidine kinase [Pseudactinotalea terrae]|uniref:sensor histidine kinase n=1 Tax=Pseudactinotalea terrae TaxID=1743262 RepID=UPI001F4FC38C|nr:HAMP domain-containing sensor histidine kinase [Pseudactinotalea terrae]
MNHAGAGPGQPARGRLSPATEEIPVVGETRELPRSDARSVQTLVLDTGSVASEEIKIGEDRAAGSRSSRVGGWFGWSVRTRVLTALTVLSALAMLVAGTTAYVLERGRLDDLMKDSLDRSSEEFLTLASEGVDPKTGAPFQDVTELLLVALGRIVPGPNEGMAGFVEGVHTYNAPAEYPYQMQQDAELIDILGPLTEERAAMMETDPEHARLITTIDTEMGSYRVAIVPVVGPAGDSGALVLAFDRGAEHAALAQSYTTYALVALGALVLIGALGFLIVSDLLKPVALLRSAAAEIGSSDLSRRIEVVGNDDLAVLTTTVNGMLDRLEHAFASQRELLDDVGHELRTPLTVVRGHLELMDTADPEDAATVRALALDELDRMTSLVEELITLAKSRRPDFVTMERTAVAVLTDDMLAKARPLGDRRWVLDSLAELEMDLDPRRITQAWLQLASNAVKFSEDGTTVALGSSVDQAAVRLWVRDEGIGIPSQEQHRVFERFVRAEGATADGSGLGLTIVRSIAQAHGGHVELTSAPGRGSTFTIVLPRTPENSRHTLAHPMDVPEENS